MGPRARPGRATAPFSLPRLAPFLDLDLQVSTTLRSIGQRHKSSGSLRAASPNFGIPPSSNFIGNFYPRSSSCSRSPSFCTRPLSRAHPFCTHTTQLDTKNSIHTSPPLEIKGPHAASRERLWCVGFAPFDPLSSGPTSFPSRSCAFAVLVSPLAFPPPFLPSYRTRGRGLRTNVTIYRQENECRVTAAVAGLRTAAPGPEHTNSAHVYLPIH